MSFMQNLTSISEQTCYQWKCTFSISPRPPHSPHVTTLLQQIVQECLLGHSEVKCLLNWRPLKRQEAACCLISIHCNASSIRVTAVSSDSLKNHTICGVVESGNLEFETVNPCLYKFGAHQVVSFVVNKPWLLLRSSYLPTFIVVASLKKSLWIVCVNRNTV